MSLFNQRENSHICLIYLFSNPSKLIKPSQNDTISMIKDLSPPFNATNETIANADIIVY